MRYIKRKGQLWKVEDSYKSKGKIMATNMKTGLKIHFQMKAVIKENEKKAKKSKKLAKNYR